MPELSQLLVASFSCEPHLYFFTGRYSEPCCLRHHVALGMLSLCMLENIIIKPQLKHIDAGTDPGGARGPGPPLDPRF